MNTKAVTEYSNEELINLEKKAKKMTIMMFVAMVILFISNIIVTFQKGFSPVFIVPIALLPILIVHIKNWKKYKNEITERKL